MSARADERVIKLYTAKNGHVWYSVGIGPPTDSGRIVDSFLLSPVVSGMGLCFRILGLAQNAELICALYFRKSKGEVRYIDIAGPNILNNIDELNDPALVLQRMRSSKLSLAGGGWHPLSMQDYPVYAALAKNLRAGFIFDESAQTYLRLHPAYRALSFIPTICEKMAAQLIMTIVDPRWYVNRYRPNSPRKLELFLGLTPSSQQRVSDAQKIITKSRDLRCAAVLSTWKTASPDAVDMALPANFLYRIWRNFGGGWRGDLRASQAFVRYFCDNWLAALDSRVGTHDGLFLPGVYFKTPAERESFVDHMRRDNKKSS